MRRTFNRASEGRQNVCSICAGVGSLIEGRIAIDWFEDVSGKI